MKIADLFVDVQLDTTKLRGQLTSTLKSLGAASVGVGILAGAALGAAKAAEKFAEVGKEVLQLKRVVGGTAEEVSRLRFAAEESGVGIDKLSRGIGIFEKNIVTGVKVADVALRDSAGNIRPVGDLVLDVADKIAHMQNPAERTALALQLFGRSGKELLPLLLRGREGIQKLMEETDKYGQVLSGKDLAAVQANIMAHRELKAAYTGVQIAIGREVLPALTSFTHGLTNSILFVGRHSAEVKILATVLAVLLIPSLVTATLAMGRFVATSAAAIWSGFIGALEGISLGFQSIAASAATATAAEAAATLGLTLLAGLVVFAFVKLTKGVKTAHKEVDDFIASLSTDNTFASTTRNIDLVAAKVKEKAAEIDAVRKKLAADDKKGGILQGGGAQNTGAVKQLRGDLKKLKDEQKQLVTEQQNIIRNTQLLAGQTGLVTDVVGKIMESAGIDLTDVTDSAKTAQQKVLDTIHVVEVQTGLSAEGIVAAVGTDIEAFKEFGKAVEAAGQAAAGAFRSAFDVVANFKPQTAVDQTQKVVDAQTKLHDATQALVDLEATQAAKKVQHSTADQIAHRKALANVAEAKAALVGIGPIKGAGQQFSEFMSKTLADAKKFAAQIQEAINRGVDPEGIAKLLEAGPAAAAPVLQGILQDHSGRLIEQYNQTNAALGAINAQVIENARLTAIAVNAKTDDISANFGLAGKVSAEKLKEGLSATTETIAAALNVPESAVATAAKQYGITGIDMAAALQSGLASNPPVIPEPLSEAAANAAFRAGERMAGQVQAGVNAHPVTISSGAPGGALFNSQVPQAGRGALAQLPSASQQAQHRGLAPHLTPVDQKRIADATAGIVRTAIVGAGGGGGGKKGGGGGGGSSAAKAAKDLAEQIATNKRDFEFEHATRTQQIALLRARLKGERKFTDDWKRDQDALEGLIADARKDAATRAANISGARNQAKAGINGSFFGEQSLASRLAAPGGDARSVLGDMVSKARDLVLAGGLAQKTYNALKVKAQGYTLQLEAMNKRHDDLSDAIDKATDKLNDANGALTDARQAYDDYAASIADSISQLGVFTSLQTTIVDQTSVDLLTGQVDDLNTALDAANQTLSQAQSAFDAAYGSKTVEQVQSLSDAQAVYNATLTKYGADSPNTIRAASLLADAQGRAAKASSDLAAAQSAVSAAQKAAASSAGLLKSAQAGRAITAGDIVGNVQSQVTAARAFASNIKTLRSRGLGQAAIMQILSAGPVGGAAFAAALVGATDGDLGVLNSAQAELDAIGKDLGGAAANWFKQAAVDSASAGVATAQGFLDGLKSKQAELEAEMAALGAVVAAAFAKALGIHSPSTVFEGFGVNSVKGYMKGWESESDTAAAMAAKLTANVAKAGTASPVGALAAGGQGGGNVILQGTVIRENVDAEMLLQRLAFHQRQNGRTR